MADLTAQKTLVKSPPELWSELSEVESLAKHLGELGEIRITKVEPESTVAWEGEEVSGTVELEQSGWGTKVTFRATVPEPDPAVEPQATEPEPEPVEPPVAEAEPVALEPEVMPAEPPVVESEPVAVEPRAEPTEPKQGFFARWLFRRRQPLPEPVAPSEPTPAPEPVAVEPEPEPVEPEPEPVEPEPEPVEPEPEPVEPPIVELEPVAIEPEPPAEPEPAPVAITDTERVQRVLDGTLEALGQAHHRPFSRG